MSQNPSFVKYQQLKIIYSFCKIYIFLCQTRVTHWDMAILSLAVSRLFSITTFTVYRLADQLPATRGDNSPPWGYIL